MRVFLVFAAALVAAGCFVFAPGVPQLAQVPDADAAQLAAGDYIPLGVCGFDEGGTGNIWCRPTCSSGVGYDTNSEEHKSDTTDPCVAEGGCGNMPKDVENCDT